MKDGGEDIQEQRKQERQRNRGHSEDGEMEEQARSERETLLTQSIHQCELNPTTEGMQLHICVGAAVQSQPFKRPLYFISPFFQSCHGSLHGSVSILEEHHIRTRPERGFMPLKQHSCLWHRRHQHALSLPTVLQPPYSNALYSGLLVCFSSEASCNCLCDLYSY